jgi:PadR family transcriptional regulator PadR
MEALMANLRPVEYKIADALVSNSLARGMSGLEITQAIGVPSGTIHPNLARLERIGMIDSGWEAARPGRPRRRLYRITGHGREERARLMTEGLWPRPGEGDASQGVPAPAT